MNRILPIVIAIFVAAFFVGVVPVSGKKDSKPLKVIAPDLVVESFEFGEYPDGAIEVPNSKVKFNPVKETSGGFVGYRLKLKTDRKEVKWAHQTDTLKCKSKEAVYPVEDGLIYVKWVITAGYPRGKHWVKGWLEGKELPKLSYTVN